jgi:hypothetical protein
LAKMNWIVSNLHRPRDSPFHKTDRCRDTAVRHPVPPAHSLTLGGRRHSGGGKQELLSDRLGDAPPIAPRDQFQHHVRRRSAASAGQDVGVPAMQRFAQVDARELLSELFAHLPVDGGASSLQKPRAREDERTIAHRSDQPMLPSKRAQAREESPVAVGFDPKARDHDGQVGGRNVIEHGGRRNFETIAGGDRAGRASDNGPSVAILSLQTVCRPQGLKRRAQSHHGEPRNDHEGHAVRAIAGAWAT